MALTKVTGKGITCSAVTEDKLGTSAVTTNKIGPNAVTSAKINNGAVTADDLASTLDLSSKTVTLPSDVVADAKRPVQDNIALLGFKMAVNDGLTVFNLVDGVVDEFNDESGTDESEGSNDLYCGTSDYYINSTQPTGVSTCISAGFTTTSITEPDTSTTGTNPAYGTGTFGTFTVPSGLSSINAYLWGGGGGSFGPGPSPSAIGYGGGGGFSTGTLAVTPGQVLEIVVAEGGSNSAQSAIPSTGAIESLGGGGGAGGATGPGCGSSSRVWGGGGSFIIDNSKGFCSAKSDGSPAAPYVYMAAAGGGAASYAWWPASPALFWGGGAGGGTTGFAATGQRTGTAQTSNSTNGNLPNGPGGAFSGGGGDQEQGGQAGAVGGSGPNLSPLNTSPQNGAFLEGGDGYVARVISPTFHQPAGGGGGGFYGGGGGGTNTVWPAGVETTSGPGGGGSSYVGHPQITCGSTTAGGSPTCNSVGGGISDPNYVAGTNEGSQSATSPGPLYPSTFGTDTGEDGYVLLSISLPATTTSTTIVSDTFTSTSVATSARLVVFEENVDTPTLNTDIIASISRDGGTTFTNATLTDSGYVTGSSGQRILTGQATISGQPSGQSMRWKLALANNTVKIHGVSLQWA